MTTSRREFLKAAGAAAAGAVVSPAVARAQAKKGVPKEPVKIGVIAIRAGIAAPVGMAGLRGTAWWADRVNKAGGILGREVQLVTEEESNPKDTVERYRKLILQEKVEVVVGGISTGVTPGAGAGGRGDGHAVAVLGRDHPEGRGRDHAQSQVGLQERGQRGRGHRGRAPHAQVLQGHQDGGGHRQRLLLRA